MISPATELQTDYIKNGFHIHRTPIFTQDEVDAGAAGMDAIRRGEYDTGRQPGSIWNPEDDAGRLCKIEMPQFANRAIRDLVSSPVLGELASRITGASMVQVWWVQLLYKPPTAVDSHATTSVGWHRDRTYWNEWEPGSDLFTAWLALSDVDEASGPMRFVVGSQHWPNVAGGDFYGQDLAAQRDGLISPDGRPWVEVAAILPPGGVSFHDDLLLHGSDPNVSGRPRRSLAIHMRGERSRPVNDQRSGLTKYIDDMDVCPVIHGHL